MKLINSFTSQFKNLVIDIIDTQHSVINTSEQMLEAGLYTMKQKISDVTPRIKKLLEWGAFFGAEKVVNTIPFGYKLPGAEKVLPKKKSEVALKRSHNTACAMQRVLKHKKAHVETNLDIDPQLELVIEQTKNQTKRELAKLSCKNTALIANEIGKSAKFVNLVVPGTGVVGNVGKFRTVFNVIKYRNQLNASDKIKEVSTGILLPLAISLSIAHVVRPAIMTIIL